jgi:hypothetical protein
VRLEGLGELKNSIHLIGSRTLDFPSFIKVPQAELYQRRISSCRVHQEILHEEDSKR